LGTTRRREVVMSTILVVAAVFLIGGLLGMFFKISIFLNVFAVSFLLAMGLCLAQPSRVTAIAIAYAVAIVVLQLGYVAGIPLGERASKWISKRYEKKMRNKMRGLLPRRN
jgi:hydrogenase/urease accessory protein HupE